MIIGVSGYGYTGSGAIIDYLKEYDECEVLDQFEFNITYMPHGVQDLEYHLTKQISRFYSSDAAIKNFMKLVDFYNSPRSPYRRMTGNKFKEISLEYVRGLVQLEWSGWWSYDSFINSPLYNNVRFRLYNRYINLWEKIFKVKFKIPQNDKMYLSIYPDNFYNASREYIKNIIDAFQCDNSKKLVLNQPFEANAPRNSMKYFSDAKAIIVDKDPRDLYVLAKKVILNNARFIPTDTVFDFIKYYKLCRTKRVDEDIDILYVKFEDMIYEYDKTKEKINTFLGINGTGAKKRHFDPMISINNTQLYLKYTDLDNDIRIIEKELMDYLYPYNMYNLKPNNGHPF